MLAAHEGKTLEFKARLGSPERFLKTVVAFSNTAGGSVLFGVEDRTRRVVGVADPLQLEARIANLVSDAVRPRLVPEIEIHPWRRSHLVAVHVFPSAAAPQYLKALGPEQGVFIRVGSTNRPADRAILDEIRRFATNRSFDEEPLPDLDSEALDFRAASESFGPLRRLTQRDLSVLGLTTRYGGKAVTTVGGLLLFGRARAERFPDAYLQAGRFSGQDRARVLDSTAISTHTCRYSWTRPSASSESTKP